MLNVDVENLIRQLATAGGVAALLTLSGCVTTTTSSYSVAKNPNVESALIATDADFSKYNRLLAEDMGIFFPADAPLAGDEIRQLRQIFRDAFLSRLQNYTITDQAGTPHHGGTGNVNRSQKFLRRRSHGNAARSLRDVAKSGSLVFLMELRDSQTSKTLARAADSAAAPVFGTLASNSTDWSSVEAAADHWAELFVNFLDQNLGH